MPVTVVWLAGETILACGFVMSAPEVGVAVGVGVTVAVGVAVGFGVAVAVGVGVAVAVGFGVRTPDQAAAIARVADGVVVGSALVELVAEHGDRAPAHLHALTSALAQAVHSAAKAPA